MPLLTLPYKEIHQRSLATLVQIFDLIVRKQIDAAIEFQRSGGRLNTRGLPRAFHQSAVPAEDKRAIFAIRSIHPKDRTWFPKGLLAPASDWLVAFCNMIAAIATHPDFPNDIVIVNYLPLVTARSALHHAEYPLNDLEVNPKEYMQDTLSRLWDDDVLRTKMHWIMSRGGRIPPPNKKTEENLAKVTFKFVTLAEYVRDFDWEGEYDASEVEKLLAEAKTISSFTDEIEVCSSLVLGGDSADRLGSRQRPTKPIEGKGEAIG
jgi:hypothetical protein